MSLDFQNSLAARGKTEVGVEMPSYMIDFLCIIHYGLVCDRTDDSNCLWLAQRCAVANWWKTEIKVSGVVLSVSLCFLYSATNAISYLSRFLLMDPSTIVRGLVPYNFSGRGSHFVLGSDGMLSLKLQNFHAPLAHTRKNRFILQGRAKKCDFVAVFNNFCLENSRDFFAIFQEICWRFYVQFCDFYAEKCTKVQPPPPWPISGSAPAI